MRIATVDRTIFELVRLQLVAAGYLPNITDYTDVAEYTAAKAEIRESGKSVIEVFGVGTARDRQGLTIAKIVIDRPDIGVGNIGAGTMMWEKFSDEVFKQYRRPDTSFNVPYTIRCICESSEYERIMYQAIVNALGTLRMIRVFDDISLELTDEVMQVVYNGYIDVSTPELTEHIFRYTIEDVWLTDPEYVKDTPAINTVDFDFQTPLMGEPLVSTEVEGDEEEALIWTVADW